MLFTNNNKCISNSNNNLIIPIPLLTVMKILCIINNRHLCLQCNSNLSLIQLLLLEGFIQIKPTLSNNNNSATITWHLQTFTTRHLKIINSMMMRVRALIAMAVRTTRDAAKMMSKDVISSASTVTKLTWATQLCIHIWSRNTVRVQMVSWEHHQQVVVVAVDPVRILTKGLTLRQTTTLMLLKGKAALSIPWCGLKSTMNNYSRRATLH